MSAIRPNREQFTALAQAPDAGPVVMLNLLKFKERTGDEGSADGAGSGREAYGRYSDAVVQMVEARGGKLLWSGTADQILIGDPAQDWDAIALVEYPSRKAFIDMVTQPEYERAHEHREAGLERTILIAMTERQRAPGFAREV
jgi:uncharacterized protein (DUF1330 family)